MRASIAVLAFAAGLSGCGILGTSSQPGGGNTPSAADDKSGGQSRAVSDKDADRKPLVPVRISDPELATDYRRSVYYEFDKYDVKPEYRALVESHAAWLRDNPAARLTVIGNTDERGPSEYNLALGQRRAESVTRMLLMLGAKAEQIEAISFGKEKPRAAGHEESAWAENRRSDFARP